MASGATREPQTMIRKNPSGDLPVIAESAFVDTTAIICGKVIVGVNAEGGMEPIIIGANSNIQDGVVIHSKSGGLVKIGEFTSIAHRSIVHGPCVVGDRVFIGFNSVLFNCVVGSGSVVRHNSVVEGCEVPEGFYIPSTTNIHSNSDLSEIKSVPPSVMDFSEDVAHTNIDLVKGYKKLQNEF
jgi:carbonic anhydrase/acetyltransferase-like protein (isoleucine patch superfamily)